MLRSFNQEPKRRYLLPAVSALAALGLAAACSSPSSSREVKPRTDHIVAPTAPPPPSGIEAFCNKLRIVRLSIDGSKETFRLTAEETVSPNISPYYPISTDYDEGFGTLDAYRKIYPHDSVTVTYAYAPPEKAVAYVEEQDNGLEVPISHCSARIPYVEASKSANQ